MSFTYRPKKKKRARTHGFLKRMSKTSGRRTLARRRSKGRKRISVWHPMLMGFKHRVSLMLTKNNRITTAEFKRLGRSTRVFNTPFFSVRIHRIVGAGKKFAVVVSKKVAATAVARNLLRRRLYTLLAERIATVPEGTAVVVFVKKEATSVSFQDLKGAIEQLGNF